MLHKLIFQITIPSFYWPSKGKNSLLLTLGIWLDLRIKLIEDRLTGEKHSNFIQQFFMGDFTQKNKDPKPSEPNV